MFNVYPTKDIKLAACLDSLGIPYRISDPVTLEIQERNGKPFNQYTFWFDISDGTIKKLCSQFVEAYEKAKPLFDWKKNERIAEEGKRYRLPDDDYFSLLGEEHPLYYQMDSLYLRDAWMHWMRSDAEPMKLMKEGNRTVVMSTRASQETKDKIKKHL